MSRDSWLIYESGYHWEGYVSMYEATGDTRYLDRMLEYTDNWIETSRPSNELPGSYGESRFRGWISMTHPRANNNEYPLFESYGWRFVAKLLYLMDGEPGYEEQFQKLLEFTETHIWDKWYSRGTRHLYRQNTHMASHWAYIGMFLGEVTRSATRREQCREVAANISHQGLPNFDDHSLRSQIVDGVALPGAAFWHPNWGLFDLPGSDVSHGEAVVTFVVEAYEFGLGPWDAEDMGAMVAMFDMLVWAEGERASDYIDGSGVGSGWIHGYVRLGRYDVPLHKRLESTNRNSIWHCGNMAASARVLRGGID
ncbi:MAG: hypothetical protein AAGF12_31985 [Myxococcota bacterium]